MMGIFKRILNRNKNPYFIAITRTNCDENGVFHTKIIYIGNVSKEEMPYGMARGVSSDGNLVYSYDSYRNTLLFRGGGFIVLKHSEIPGERISALPTDTVVVYDMTKVKRRNMKSSYEKKILLMYKNGELEFIPEIEERNIKIDDILNSK